MFVTRFASVPILLSSECSIYNKNLGTKIDLQRVTIKKEEELQMHDFPVADPGENLTGALHSNFGRGGCGGLG